MKIRIIMPNLFYAVQTLIKNPVKIIQNPDRNCPTGTQQYYNRKTLPDS